MPLNTTGVGGSLISIVTPQPRLTAVVGNIYVSGGGGQVTITSPQNTILVGTPGASSFTLDIAQDGAVLNQVLQWNGTKWAPATVATNQEVYSGSGAPTGITPASVNALYYDLLSTNLWEWNATATPPVWVQATSGSGGANYLYELKDVQVQETGGTWSANLLGASTIVGYTDKYLQIQGTALSVAVGDRLSSGNTNPSNTAVVTSITTAGPLQQINFSGGVFPIWAPSGSLIQMVYRYTPTALATGRVLAWDQSIPAWTDQAVINNLAVGAAGTNRTGPIKFLSGTNTTIVDNGDGTFTWNATGGGGGGAFSSVMAIWTTANSNTKNAYSSYTSPAINTVNADGITINFVATSGSGSLTNCTVSLNGVAVTGTFTSTGTFPNYAIVIPQATIATAAAQTAANVAVSIQGTFSSSNFNVMSSPGLVNNQPIPFTTTLTASYADAQVPYYNLFSRVNWSYTNSAQITTFGGFVTLSSGQTNFTSPTGQSVLVASTGGPIGGSAVGLGLNGAVSSTVNFTGSLPAVPTYIPAFYAQATAGTTPPNFKSSPSANLQTAGAALNSTITYAIPTNALYYGWIAIPNSLALSNIYVRTLAGDFPLVPDITAPTTTIVGVTYLVFGFTNFSLVQALVLVIK